MFSVLFEVNPKGDQWDAYLGYARALRPELEQIDGFVDNVRYRSLTRDGRILSLSNWEGEKALVRWRTHAGHHAVQVRGRGEVFADYHLRVGQLTHDTELSAGQSLTEQRLDVTEAGEGTTVTLVSAQRPSASINETSPEALATSLGLAVGAEGLVSWDVFDAVLAPGEVILLLSWRDQRAADLFRTNVALQNGERLRQVRVVRDYGMYDRRESPQYYPELSRP